MKNFKAMANASNLLALSILSLTVMVLITFLPVGAMARWESETIDGVQYLGTSIAVDSKGKIHISEAKGGELVYISNATGEWLKEVLDSTGIVKEYLAIAVDNNDKIHISYRISYHDAPNGNLKYATNASGVWVKRVLDTEGTVGEYTSIGLSPKFSTVKAR